MSVWKDRGRWRWRVMRHGHAAAGSAGTRQAAQEAEAAALRRLTAGLRTDGRHTLAAAFVRYLESSEFRALTDQRGQADKLAQWEGYLGAHVLEAAPAIAERAVGDWLGKGLAVATINRRLAALRRVLALAYRRWQWTESDIAGRISLLPGERQRQVWLTPEQAARLRRACPPGRLRAAISLLLATGLRVSELLRLSPADVRDGAVFLDARTKTNRPRAVPILAPGTRYLRWLPIVLTYDGLRSAFDKAKARAGLPHVRLHDLRHTTGSALAKAGATTRDIQLWLGHASIVTTTRYTHVELQRLQAIAMTIGTSKIRAKGGAKQAIPAPDDAIAHTEDAR